MLLLVLIGLFDGSCVLSRLLTLSELSSCLPDTDADTDDDNEEGGEDGEVTLLVSKDGLRG